MNNATGIKLLMDELTKSNARIYVLINKLRIAEEYIREQSRGSRPGGYDRAAEVLKKIQEVDE